MIYVFDAEVYKNFFCVTFLDIYSDGAKVFIRYEDRDDVSAIVDFINNPNLTLVGFNSLKYDNIILNGLKNGLSNFQLYELSQSIISGKSQHYDFRPTIHQNIDLMSIMAFDVMKISLKRVAIMLKWHKIQELPIPFNEEIIPKQIPILLDYNLNDCGITKELHWNIKKEIDLRFQINERFGVDVTSASRSKIGDIILKKMYAELADYSNFREISQQKLSARKIINLSDCIAMGISFKTKEFKNLLNVIRSTKLTIGDKKPNFEREVFFRGKSYRIKLGGLHSNDSAGIYKSTNNNTLRDADATSFYPYVMIPNKIKPAHLDDCFYDITETLTYERVEAKEEGDETKADVFKIVINSTLFGKMGSDKHWLYDPLAFYSVTISGQLYLLMLVEMLELKGIEVISANTDGLVSNVKHSDEKLYQKICSEWSEITKFALGHSSYKSYIRGHVNSYLAVEESGKIKKKGYFCTELELHKGYKFPIIAKALEMYFINGVDYSKYIRSSTDIYDFLMSEKTSKKFRIEFRQNGNAETIQRTNRFFVSNKGGELVKIADESGKEISFCAGWNVEVVNNLDASEIWTYDINYHFYEQEVKKIIRAIEPKYENLSLF